MDINRYQPTSQTNQTNPQGVNEKKQRSTRHLYGNTGEAI